MGKIATRGITVLLLTGTVLLLTVCLSVGVLVWGMVKLTELWLDYSGDRWPQGEPWS